jgi:thymidylate synthase
MQAYLDLLDHVLTHGHRKEDRTGTGRFRYLAGKAGMRWLMDSR